MAQHVEAETQRLNQPSWSKRLLGLALILSLGALLWLYYPVLGDRYRVVRDVQNFYWMARAQDPTLFATDYLYISSDSVIELDVQGFHLLVDPYSPGYGLFFYLASVVLEYVWLTKLSAILLTTLCIVVLYKTGQYLQDNLTGLSLSLLTIFFLFASPLSISILSGLQRAFALPLMILFLYFLLRRQCVGAAIMIVVSALIYLPSLPPMVLAYGFSLVRVERPLKLSLAARRSSLIALGISVLLSAVVAALALSAQLDLLPVSKPPGISAAIPDQVPISENPAFQAEGSTPLFFAFPFLGRAGIFDTGGDVTNFLVIMIFVFLIYKTVGPKSVRRIPGPVWCLLLGGLVMYLVSLFFLVGLSSSVLYLPSRYTRSTLFLFGLFFIGLNWVDFLHELPRWLRKNGRLLLFFVISLSLALAAVYLFFPLYRPLLVATSWMMGVFVAGILALLGGSALFWLATRSRAFPDTTFGWGALLSLGLLVVFAATVYIKILGVKTTNPSEHERNVYEYVAQLPKDTVLAGDPDIMTNIPLFSRRSVLFRELFPRTDAPIVEYFDAQYAESAQPVLDFCRRYQIGYLVLDSREFSLDYLVDQKFFYQPWNDRIVELVTDRSDFVLTQVQPVYSSGPLLVIKCDVDLTGQLSAAD